MLSVFTFQFASIIAQIPTRTNTPPVMEVLDDDHVLVDYSNSFNIPDFSKIKIASVLVEGYDHGIATREHVTTTRNEANEVHQKLTKNAKLKAKCNPCKMQRFCVRLTFEKDPKYVDSLTNEYVPQPLKEVCVMCISI